jgi:hypothetical protein
MSFIVGKTTSTKKYNSSTKNRASSKRFFRVKYLALISIRFPIESIINEEIIAPI